MKGIHSPYKMRTKPKLLYIQRWSPYSPVCNSSVRNPTPDYFFHLMAEFYWHVVTISSIIFGTYLTLNYEILIEKNHNTKKTKLNYATALICLLSVVINCLTITFFFTVKGEMNSLGPEGITSVTTKPALGLSTPPLVVHFVHVHFVKSILPARGRHGNYGPCYHLANNF